MSICNYWWKHPIVHLLWNIGRSLPSFITISFILLGFSGAIAPVLMNAAFLSTNEKYHNEISSLVNLLRQMGSILGVMIVSIMLDLFINENAILYFLLLTMLIPFMAYFYLVWANKLETKPFEYVDQMESSHVSKD